jgi:hypothetical protein
MCADGESPVRARSYESWFARRAGARKSVKPRQQKYFALSETQIMHMLRRPAPQEGRIAIVTTLDAGCDGRVGFAGRATPMRTVKSCGSGPPTLGPSLAVMIREGDGG